MTSFNLGEASSGNCVGAIAGQDLGLGDDVWLLGDRFVHSSFTVRDPRSRAPQLHEERVHRVLCRRQRCRLRRPLSARMEPTKSITCTPTYLVSTRIRGLSHALCCILLSGWIYIFVPRMANQSDRCNIPLSNSLCWCCSTIWFEYIHATSTEINEYQARRTSIHRERWKVNDNTSFIV